MLTIFKVLSLLVIGKSLQQITKINLPHFKPVARLPCEMQTFENDTYCAEITIKSL